MTSFNKVVGVAGLVLTLFVPALCSGDSYANARRQMLKAIEDNVRETSLYIDRQALNPAVMEVIGRVPRHNFVPSSQKSHAYENRPLPIGYGQTISQPYIVALMTDLLRVEATSRVLEIGTGSGYQAAILSELVDEVYTVEIIEELATLAKQRLKKLGYDNVQVRTGDGYFGWSGHAPFDVIIVTAAASHVPPPLIRQLKAGGRMVIPVGSRFMTQELVLIEKQTSGELITHQILPVRFVPLTGGH